MGCFYHIYVSVRADVTMAQVEAKMNLAVDWFRYDANNWIVYTTSSAKTWYARFRKYIEPGGHLFVCQLDTTDYWGFMPRTLWTWLRKSR